MENSIKNITLLASMILLQLIFPQEWELTMTAQDVAGDGSSDYIRIGSCDGCHDGFYYTEDQYDLPNGGNTYTDIQIFNFDWLGTQDDHDDPVTCINPNFYVDKRAIHEPEFLSEWLISGSIEGLPQNTQVQLSWTIDNLINDIDIFLYIDDTGYDMKNQASLIIDSSDLNLNTDPETNTETVNVKILAGGCASTGTTTYYFDEDSDGLGTGQSADYCPDSQPEGWVLDNTDVDDTIYCIDNNIDQCNICDGENADDLGCGCFEPGPSGCDNTCGSTLENDDCGVCNGGNIDMDDCGVCNGGNVDMDDCGVCNGGNVDMDDCGECNGFNQSCIDEIFEDGPQNLIALINDGLINLSWDQPNYPSDNGILGFNIYIQNETTQFITNTIEESITLPNHSEGTFCVSAYDHFDNESTYSCSEASEMVMINITLHDGANLISYPALPADVGLENIFASIEDEISGVITEGLSAAKVGDWWVGSLIEIDPLKGYWVIIELEDVFAEINYEILGFPTDYSIQYQLWEGANLISYIGNDDVPLDAAIPDADESNFTEIIAEGYAAYNHPIAGWLGSLTTFNIGKGYWVKVSQDLNLQWGELNTFTSSFGRVSPPEESSTFNFNQSSEQAFYYISEIDGFTPTSIDDKIISYCNSKITGSRNWNGIYTDIPAMGDDGNNYSEGYCKVGDKPEFKFYDAKNDVLVSLESSDVSPWTSNSITFMSLSIESIDINLPSNAIIHGAYPNPFNPNSTMEYSLSKDSQIELSILDVNGKKVETLYNGYKNAGFHQIIWNAERYSSGMYFFTLNTPDGIYNHKLILLK